MSLAAQNFISGIANDAFAHAEVRSQETNQRRRDKKIMLTMQDLSKTLSDYGVNVEKPAYFTSTPGNQ